MSQSPILIHRNTHQRQSSNDSLLSQVSNWDQYQSKKQQPDKPHHVRMKKRNHLSIRRSNFTNQKEIKSNKFLFHKGFFKRYLQKQSKPKFKSPDELNSVMKFINMSTLSLNKTIPLPGVVQFAPINKKSRSAAVVPRMGFPCSKTQMYKRQNSIKRQYIPITNQQTRLLNLKRSNTTNRVQMTRKQSQLYNLWSQYLKAAVYQRIQLRLSLINFSASSTPASSYHSLQHHKGTKDDPIIISDDRTRRKIY